MDEIYWKIFDHCHTCQKTLKPEFVGAHKSLGHKVESYKTLPSTSKPPKKQPAIAPGETLAESYEDEA